MEGRIDGSVVPAVGKRTCDYKKNECQMEQIIQKFALMMMLSMSKWLQRTSNFKIQKQLKHLTLMSKE